MFVFVRFDNIILHGHCAALEASDGSVHRTLHFRIVLYVPRATINAANEDIDLISHAERGKTMEEKNRNCPEYYLVDPSGVHCIFTTYECFNSAEIW